MSWLDCVKRDALQVFFFLALAHLLLCVIAACGEFPAKGLMLDMPHSTEPGYAAPQQPMEMRLTRVSRIALLG